MSSEKWELNCYGMTTDQMREMVSESLSGPSMLAMSILSDAQEMIERDQKENARKAMNVAKWIISEYLREPRHDR